MTDGVIVDAVTVRYGKPTALDRVGMTVPFGRMVAVTGASGAGKTSLLWTMSGLVKPDTGKVTIGGRRVSDHDDALRASVALIPQGNGLASVLTALENVVVALRANGSGPKEATTAAREALRSLGVEGQANQLAEELSGGQRQRVAIARGLALRPAVLLADEITSDLDSVNRDLALTLLRAEADRGAAVVLATHDLDAAAVCDSQWHLRDGRMESVPHNGSDRSEPPKG